MVGARTVDAESGGLARGAVKNAMSQGVTLTLIVTQRRRRWGIATIHVKRRPRLLGKERLRLSRILNTGKMPVSDNWHELNLLRCCVKSHYR